MINKLIIYALVILTSITETGSCTMSNASPGQPPHYLIKSSTPEPLTGISKLEGSPAVPAELASIQQAINSLIDNAELDKASLETAPLGILKVNADGTYGDIVGKGTIVAIDASTPGAYAITYQPPSGEVVNNAFVNVYAANSFGDAVSITQPVASGDPTGITVNVRTGGVLTQQKFSIAFYR